MKNSNDLRFNKTKVVGKLKITAKISINDKCNNGHQDLHVTCDIYEKRGNGRYYEHSFGCQHETVLKHFPEFKIFVDLHGCDFNGCPTFTVGNGLYFLHNETKEITINYLRITEKEYSLLLKCKSEDFLKYTLDNLEIPKRWKKEANKAIQLIEDMTKIKFLNDSKKSQYTPLTDQEKRDFYNKFILTDFYSDKNTTIRENKRLSDLNKSMIEKVNFDYSKQITKYEKEKNICLELINQGFEISVKTGNIKGAIYYTHSNELNFNWSTEKIKESAILNFIENLDPIKFEGLKISNDKEELTVI
tara:strand:+ start:1827 stop:2735 length:909 start_codon:yes stop_codon:yes gene_type:complete